MDYTKLDGFQLQAEKERLVAEYIGLDPRMNPFENMEYVFARVEHMETDTSNPIVQKLAAVEEELQKRIAEHKVQELQQQKAKPWWRRWLKS